VLPLADHPQRFEAANELHARPFPTLAAPAEVGFFALMAPPGAARDGTNLAGILDHFGAAHPPPGASHHAARLGRFDLKWERHTEFESFMLVSEGPGERPFDPALMAGFPETWTASLDGRVITVISIRVERLEDESEVAGKLGRWFVPEAVACARVLDDSAIVATDFSIDSDRQIRMALFVRPDTGPRRIGRVVQRLTEIETYKAISMLGLIEARALGPDLAGLDTRLAALIRDMSAGPEDSATTLEALLRVAADLERINTEMAFRFGATGAYAALVDQRIAALRETRFHGWQTFAEFMTRRFDPAMRTVRATEARLAAMADRARRAGELLRTRVDVERSAQNQSLLASMDRRAGLQLRLQETVEGLSVVAISYYAVNLGSYLLAPAAGWAGLHKGAVSALLTVPVIAAVWLLSRRVRRRLR